MKIIVKYPFAVLFLLGVLSLAAFPKEKNISTIGKTYTSVTAGTHTVPIYSVDQGKSAQLLPRTNDFSNGIVTSITIFPPARISYNQIGFTANHYSGKLYTRYLPRDPPL